MILKEVFCSDILKEVFCSDIERGDFNRKRVGRVSINIGKRGRLPTKRKNCNLQTPWENIIGKGGNVTSKSQNRKEQNLC